MIVLVPFFGQKERFRPLLDKWIEAKKAAAPALTWFALTDEPMDYNTPHAVVDISGFADLIRPGQPFDVKGALVCAALLKFPEPLLVLDADAVILRDPTPSLAKLAECPIAMPIDAGAIVHFRTPRLNPPYNAVRKLCAGVMWFGANPAGRSRLVAGYRRAFEEMRELIPWTPRLPHLLEQYAWSVVHHRRGGALLPNLMNWHAAYLGPRADVVVAHDYGHKKWRGQKAPANT